MLGDIVSKYRNYNPATGAFDLERTSREYADLLDINYVYLRQILTGVRQPGTETLGKLMRAFPEKREDIAQAVAVVLTAPQAVPA